MPIDDSVAHLQLVIGFGIVWREPGREQPVPMTADAVERMCTALEAKGDHAEAARHRQEHERLQALAQRMANPDGSRRAEQSS